MFQMQVFQQATIHLNYVYAPEMWTAFLQTGQEHCRIWKSAYYFGL